MLNKENLKKYLFIAIMAYLAVCAVYQFYNLISMIIATIAGSRYTFGAISAISYIFTCLAYLSLLAITASVAVAQLRSYKPKLERLWFLPACFYAVVFLITLISIFITARYNHGFGEWLNWIFSSLFTVVSTALYLLAFMLLYPKTLLSLDEGPVLGSGAKDAPEADAADDAQTVWSDDDI